MTELRADAGRLFLVEATLTRAGVPIDTTQPSFQAWFTVKASREDADGDALIAKETGGGGIAVNTPSHASKHKLTVTVDAADTDSVTEPLDYYWELTIDDPASNRGPETIDRGVLKLAAPVLRTPA
jgi:hypothetical protein